jgi:hypothetical protein
VSATYALPAPATLLWLLATTLLIGLAASGIVQRITWYLAVDQYGYLAFAHDLMRGHVFHHWAPLDVLAAHIPAQVDVLSQTYIYDHGRLYCRYAPGFSIMLAGWLLLFGDDGAHYLNPTVYLTLLVLLLLFQRRLFRSRWRATVGVALTILCPSYLHLWGTTLVRDLSTHLMGLTGLFLLLPAGRRLGPGRLLAAGLTLGYAGSIRPDSVIYTVPALLIVTLRWRRERAAWPGIWRGLGAGALGLLLGLGPFFAYNWVATGNPLRPTQGMEIQNFFPSAAPAAPQAAADPEPHVGYPPGAWHGGVIQAVQGGGLSLRNLPRVLPGNMQLLRSAYGDLLLGVALWGALVALVRRRILFVATVPYAVLALLLYSCWVRPDARYLSGVYCLLPMLMVEGLFGTLDLVRRLVRAGRPLDARRFALVVAAALVAAAAAVPMAKQATALPAVALLAPLGAAAALVAAAAWPARRIARFAVPALAVALVALSAYRALALPQSRAVFQRPQMLRARATLARLVEPNAVIITDEDVGRPGENIDYYSGVAHAFYITDLTRWRLPLTDAPRILLEGGMVPYLFIPPSQPGHDQILQNLRGVYAVDLVAKVPARQAMEFFVAAPFHRGIEMELYRLKPKRG